MAPEVSACGSRGTSTSVPFDSFKADVWSLGICFFAMLFGFFPFEHSDPSKDWRASKARDAQREGLSVVNTIIGFYPKKRISVSADAKKLIDSMLTFDPCARASLSDVLSSSFLLPSVSLLRRVAQLALTGDPTGADDESTSICSLSIESSSNGSPRSSSVAGSVALRTQRQGSNDTMASVSSVGSSVHRTVARLGTLVRQDEQRGGVTSKQHLPGTPEQRQLHTLPLPPHSPYRPSQRHQFPVVNHV